MIKDQRDPAGSFRRKLNDLELLDTQEQLRATKSLRMLKVKGVDNNSLAALEKNLLEQKNA